MIITITKYLVILHIFLPPNIKPIDQDYASSVLNLNNFGLVQLAKDLSDISGLDDNQNETLFIPNGLNSELLNSSENGVIAKFDTESDGQNKLTKTKSNSGKNCYQQIDGIKADLITDKITNEEKKIRIGQECDRTQLAFNRNDEPNDKILEKRDTQVIANDQETLTVTLKPNQDNVSKFSPQISEKEEGEISEDNESYDLKKLRQFRDTYEESEKRYNSPYNAGLGAHNVIMKESLNFVKPKGKCVVCDDKVHKVVSANNFIDIGGDREDDNIKKFRSIISLLDNIIESAGSVARKELGLARTSKLQDTAAVVRTDDDKRDKTIEQIISCVKDALKHQMSSSNCEPLPRELHSFLIWLIHGTEGGSVLPPNVQEGRARPSYLFHEDNHKPHFSGGACSSFTSPRTIQSMVQAIEAVPSNRVITGSGANNLQFQQENKAIDQQGFLKPRKQYEIAKDQQIINPNKPFLGSQKPSDQVYQRKSSFFGNTYYNRADRSVSDNSDCRADDRKMFPREVSIDYPNKHCINYIHHEHEPRNLGDYSDWECKNYNKDIENDEYGKPIFKREVSKTKCTDPKPKSGNRGEKSRAAGRLLKLNQSMKLRNDGGPLEESHPHNDEPRKFYTKCRKGRKNGRLVKQKLNDCRESVGHPLLCSKLNDTNCYREFNNLQHYYYKIINPTNKNSVRHKTVIGSSNVSLRPKPRYSCLDKDVKAKMERENPNISNEEIKENIKNGNMDEISEKEKIGEESDNTDMSDDIPGIELYFDGSNIMSKPVHCEKDTDSAPPSQHSTNNRPNKTSRGETHEKITGDLDLDGTNHLEKEYRDDQLDNYQDNYFEYDGNHPKGFYDTDELPSQNNGIDNNEETEEKDKKNDLSMEKEDERPLKTGTIKKRIESLSQRHKTGDDLSGNYNKTGVILVSNNSHDNSKKMMEISSDINKREASIMKAKVDGTAFNKSAALGNLSLSEYPQQRDHQNQIIGNLPQSAPIQHETFQSSSYDEKLNKRNTNVTLTGSNIFTSKNCQSEAHFKEKLNNRLVPSTEDDGRSTIVDGEDKAEEVEDKFWEDDGKIFPKRNRLIKLHKGSGCLRDFFVDKPEKLGVVNNYNVLSNIEGVPITNKTFLAMSKRPRLESGDVEMDSVNNASVSLDGTVMTADRATRDDSQTTKERQPIINSEQHRQQSSLDIRSGIGQIFHSKNNKSSTTTTTQKNVLDDLVDSTKRPKESKLQNKCSPLRGSQTKGVMNTQTQVTKESIRSTLSPTVNNVVSVSLSEGPSEDSRIKNSSG